MNEAASWRGKRGGEKARSSCSTLAPAGGSWPARASRPLDGQAGQPASLIKAELLVCPAMYITRTQCWSCHRRSAYHLAARGLYTAQRHALGTLCVSASQPAAYFDLHAGPPLRKAAPIKPAGCLLRSDAQGDLAKAPA